MTGRKGKDVMTESKAEALASSQCVPIYNQDMDFKQGLEDTIYLLNLAGVPLQFLSTSHATDTKGENRGDPANYVLEGKQVLGHREYTRVSVPNKIWVTYQYQAPNATYVTSASRIDVPEPNGSTLTFFRAADGILKFTIDRDELTDPNDFIISNKDMAFTLHVQIYTQNPEARDPRCKTMPVFETKILKGVQQAFTLVNRYSFWIAKFAQEIGEIGPVDLVDAIRNKQAGNFRVGSHEIYDGIGNIGPGSYVVAMVGDNENTHQFVLKAFATTSLRLVRPVDWK